MKLIEAEKAKDVIHEYFKSLMAKDASGANVYKLAVGIVSCLEHDANLLKAIDGLPSAEPDTTTHDSIPAKTGKNDGDGTSGDCISRQAAIDAMAELQGRASTKAELKGISKAWKRIKQLPSAQPEQRWIPVGERLPDTNRDVLLQFSTSMGVGFWENGEWGVNTGDNIYSEIGEGEAQPIAWCELPEQYQGGGKQKRGEQE